MRKEGVKLKVCGMRDNIAEVAQLMPDFLGFIFYSKSPRYFNLSTQPDLSILDPLSIKKIGVFVNEEIDFIEQSADEFGLDLLQLHGKESPETCKVLKGKGHQIIKAFSVDETFNLEILEAYEPFVDYFLFDTKTVLYGGSGKTFDWEILNNYPSGKPYFLSGGLDNDNIENIKNLEDPRLFAIDVNSKYEISPGLKDIEKLKVLKAKLTAINNLIKQ